MATSVNEGLWRFSGMYGEARRDGAFLGDVTEVSGTVEIQQIEVPLVGRLQTQHKRGRETRTGTLRVQKMDAKWEMEIYRALSQSLDDRRAIRDLPANQKPTVIPGAPFSLIIDYDDPDALGVERWQLDGVQLWRLTLGFAMTEDLVEREYPMTWERETPLDAFVADTSTANAQPAWVFKST